MDEKQFFDLFEQKTPRLRAYFHDKLKGRIPKSEMSETKTQLVERTCLKIWEAVSHDKLNAGYSFGLLVSLCRKDIWKDYVRERKREAIKPKMIPLDEIVLEPQAINFPERYEASDIIQQLMQRLTTKDREFLQARLDGMKLKEIAESRNVTEGAVKMQAKRMMDWMKSQL